MKNLAAIFRGLAEKTKSMDDLAFSWSTKKSGSSSWQITIDEGLEPYLRLEEITDPDSVTNTEERVGLICELLNNAPEMSETAARSQENRDLAQDMLDALCSYFDALDKARMLTTQSGVTSDSSQRALIAASKAESELRALIVGSGGSAA